MSTRSSSTQPDGYRHTINKAEIRTLIPHSGSMCLLDEVTQWDDRSIVCATNTHRDPANPLRRNGHLSAVHAFEYGAQAAAVHGGDRARRRRSARKPHGPPPAVWRATPGCAAGSSTSCAPAATTRITAAATRKTNTAATSSAFLPSTSTAAGAGAGTRTSPRCGGSASSALIA